MPGTKCMYRLRNGNFCSRWANHTSKFCSHHEGSLAHFDFSEGDELHPLQRLTTPEDIFSMLREALNATRLGRMTPAQAHALGHLSAEWRKTYEMLSFRTRETGLYRQFLTDLMIDDKKAESELAEAPHPLPIAIDNVATVNQPMPNAPPLEPVENYPGYYPPQPATPDSPASPVGAALRRPPHHAPPASAEAALRSEPSNATDDGATAA
jgi:hypothetical protein